MSHRDFPAGLVVKNPLANAEDVGSISGPERSHILWGQLSLCEEGIHRAWTPSQACLC